MNVFYHFVLWLCTIIVWAASFFNTKIRLFRKGRQGIFKRLQAAIPKGIPVAWFHCASLGEFEQGQSVIAAFRAAYPDYKIVLTFFSPSGYEIQKNYVNADWVFYLPIDTAYNARRFVKTVNPAVAVFIKYEFWYNFLAQLRKYNIPTYIVAAIFHPSQAFFKWYGRFFRRMLKAYHSLFVQNENSKKLLAAIGVTNVEILGDTRFDRVVSLAKQAEELPAIAAFCSGHSILIAGSTWQTDEGFIAAAFEKHRFPAVKLIIAPHNVEAARITRLEKLFAEYAPIRYSKIQMNDLTGLANSRMLIIDTVGLLSLIYRYGTVAYVGGGFNVSGIHNILEAAVYGKPIIFGSNYQRFQEAIDLIKLGGAASYSSKEEFNVLLTTWLLDKEKQLKAGAVCSTYVQQHTGATEKIMQRLTV